MAVGALSLLLQVFTYYQNCKVHLLLAIEENGITKIEKCLLPPPDFVTVQHKISPVYLPLTDMMERHFAKFFISLVKELIPEEDEREKLFEALRRYQSSQDLLRLMTDLRLVLDEPSKLELYEFLRPLILLRHQIPYSQMAPPSPGARLHAVRLHRRPGESLGFAVRGGYEHGVGIFVTDVAPGSQADRQGLKIGDEIVRVNGFTISEAVHDDVLRLIKSRDDIVLKVVHIGMIPVREEATDNVTWKYVDDLSTFSENAEEHVSQGYGSKRSRDIKIFIDSTGHASIGCTILSEQGPAVRYRGIFVEKVRPGSLADEVGLQSGDQILEVNSTSFKGITWKEALLALKSSRQLHFVIRKNSLPAPLLPRSENQSTNQQPPQSESSAVESQTSPPPPAAAATATPQRSAAVGDERVFYHHANDEQLDEGQIIQHQLNLRASRPSPSSSMSSGSVISTSAQVHVTTLLIDKSTGSGHRYGDNFEQQSSPLGGAAAAKLEQRRLEGSGKASNSPRLLELEGEFGWTDRVPARIYQKFSSEDLNGRLLKCLSYRKTSNLGVAVEGGAGSPLGGKILVSLVFDDGVAYRSGKMKVGDQLMMINGRKLLDLTLAEAEKILQTSSNSSKDSTVEVIYCESTLVNDEDSVTYF
ncbi:harmonin [Plakobranchus ocellatus]|uniref:Harmonin n=1 Tax=Plakobranchus ocellatus TaxID=259542 RepID=A0AAV4DM61_9GAST|nr:harmonin [Plakobranchus ocellatus]